MVVKHINFLNLNIKINISALIELQFKQIYNKNLSDVLKELTPLINKENQNDEQLIKYYLELSGDFWMSVMQLSYLMILGGNNNNLPFNNFDEFLSCFNSFELKNASLELVIKNLLPSTTPTINHNLRLKKNKKKQKIEKLITH